MHDTPTLRKGGDDLRPSCTAYPQPRRSASRSSHEVPALSTMPPSTASPSTAELRADLIQHSEQFADRAKAVLESTRMASTIDVSRTSAHPSSSVERAHVLLEDARNETSRWKKYNDALESPTPSENGTRKMVDSTAPEWQRNLPRVGAVPIMPYRECSPIDLATSSREVTLLHSRTAAEVTQQHRGATEYPMLQRPRSPTYAPSLVPLRAGGVPPSLTAVPHVRATSSTEPAIPIGAPQPSDHRLARANAPLMGEGVISPAAHEQPIPGEFLHHRYASQPGHFVSARHHAPSRSSPGLPRDHPSLASSHSADAPTLTHASKPVVPAAPEGHQTSSVLRQKTLTLEQKLCEMESTLEAHKSHLRRIDQETCNASAFVAQIAHAPSLDEVAGCILRFAHNMKSTDTDAPNTLSSLQLKSMLTMFPPFYTWLHHASLWSQWGLYVPVAAFERAVNAFFFADDVTGSRFGQLKNIIQARTLPQTHPAWCAERSSVRGHVISAVHNVNGTDSAASSPQPSSRSARAAGETKMGALSAHQSPHARAIIARVSHNTESSRYASVHSACSSNTMQPSAKNATAWREEAEKWRHKYKKRAQELDDALAQAAQSGTECAQWSQRFSELEQTQQTLCTTRMNLEQQLAQVHRELEDKRQDDIAASGDRIAALDTRLRDEAVARQEAQGQVGILQEQLSAMELESARLAHLHEVEVSNCQKQKALHDEKQQLFNRVLAEKEEDIARRKQYMEHQYRDMEESMRSTENRMERKLEHQALVESDTAEKLQFEMQLRLRMEDDGAIVKEQLHVLRESLARIELEKELAEARLRIKLADGEVSLASDALSQEKEHTESLMHRLRADLEVARKQTRDALDESAHAATKFTLQRQKDQTDRIALKNESVELRLESEREIADVKQKLRHVEMEASSQSEQFFTRKRLEDEKNKELRSRSDELRVALCEQQTLLNNLSGLTKRASLADDAIAREGVARHELERRLDAAEVGRKRLEVEVEAARRDVEEKQRQCTEQLRVFEAEQSEMQRIKHEHSSAAFAWKGELLAEQEQCHTLESEMDAHASHRETIDRYKESLRAEHVQLESAYRDALEKNADLEMEKQQRANDFRTEIEEMKLEKYSGELGLQQELLDAARSVKAHESEIERMRKLRADREKSLERECADLKEQLKRLNVQAKYDHDEFKQKKDREWQIVNDLQNSKFTLAQELFAAKVEVTRIADEMNVEQEEAAMHERRDAERVEALQKAAELSLNARHEASEAVDRLTQELHQESVECKKHRQVALECDASISAADKTKEAAEKEARMMKEWALTLKKELGFHQYEMGELKNARANYDDNQMEQSREKNMKLQRELEDARRHLFAAQEKEAVQCQRADDAEIMVQFASEKAQIELDEIRRRNLEEAECCYANAETLERTVQREAAEADRLRFDVREEIFAYKTLREITSSENAQAVANQDRLERLHDELIQQMNHSKDLEEKLSSESAAAMRAVHLQFELMGEKSRTRELEADIERAQKEATEARGRVLDLAATAEHAQARSAVLQEELRLILANAEKSNRADGRVLASWPMSARALTTPANSPERVKSPPSHTYGLVTTAQKQSCRPPHSPYLRDTAVHAGRTSPLSPPPFGDPNCPWKKKPSHAHVRPVTPGGLKSIDMNVIFGAWPALKPSSSTTPSGFFVGSGADGFMGVTAGSGTQTPGMASTKSTTSLARINIAAESAIDTLKTRGDHSLADSVEHMRKELLSELNEAWDSIHRAEHALCQGDDSY
eukprot:GEMP01000855.1.p1 GENE.GEMP01000855.1~~GEMP01000855.1.p1  ORF type:complete len:1783 (+),score=446.98 GEMP01000855.1:40-5349(+)